MHAHQIESLLDCGNTAQTGEWISIKNSTMHSKGRADYFYGELDTLNYLHQPGSRVNCDQVRQHREDDPVGYAFQQLLRAL